jgi:hypothetical protein
MLNSNLKSDIQKNIKIKRLKTKKRSDRVWPSANTNKYYRVVVTEDKKIRGKRKKILFHNF